jgi:ATP-dependent helicase/nuclease subunit A
MALPIGASVTELVATSPAESKLGATTGASRSAALWVGTAIHAALESLDLARELAPQWAGQRARIAAQIAATAAPGECDAAIADALACWDALAKSPLAARLRGISARVLARELPVLLAPVAGSDRAGALGFVTGSVDLLYRDDDGRLVVVDYKTDRVDPRSDASDARARYARQGELYCRAVAEALGADRPPRFEIWWLRSGSVEAVPERRAAGASDR